MDAHITRFEEYSEQNWYDSSTWACNLRVQLIGNALAVFHRMQTDEQRDYETLKDTLLRTCQMTETGYRDVCL